MSWRPNDLVTDADLLAYESNILEQFGRYDWKEKRGKAIEDWLAPILRSHGFPIERLRTRYEVDQAFGYTAAAFSDVTAAVKSTTADDLNLATTFATAGSDALYIGYSKVFRGLSVRLLESVSSVTGTVTVAYWNDGWTALTVADGTAKTTGKTLSGGGAMTWRVPDDWVVRPINSSDPRYWVKVTVSATPTGATAGQIAVIRQSLLRGPVTFRTLSLIFREAPTGGPGPWADKASYYETEADAALQRALTSLGSEFDTDESDQVSEEEGEQTTAEITGGWRMERA
jgi:hypothetical protein